MASVAEQLQTALEHHRAGRLAQAEPLYRQILQADPRQADAWRLLGVIAHTTGHPQEALACLTRALGLDSTQPSYHFDYAEVYRSLGRLKEAEAGYRQVLRLNPGHAQAHNNLGTLLQGRDQLAEAEQHYREALRLRPGYAMAANNLGTVLLERGDLAEARTHFQDALRVEPAYVEAHNNLGATWQREGNLERARACFEEASRLRPTYASAWLNLGMVAQSEGQLTQAVDYFRQARRFKPDLAEAQTGEAAVLLTAQRLDEARTVLGQMERSAARRVFLQHLESLVFTTRIGEYDAVLELAQSLLPDDAYLDAAWLYRRHFDETLNAARLAEQYRGWSAKYFLVPAVLPPAQVSVASGRIRLAYVGTYLHHMCMENVFRHHDRERFEILVFTDDRRVDLARAYPGLKVFPVQGTNLVQACREHGVQLAVDLVGPVPFRGGMTQMPAFHERLAPVQCAWVATVNTSGNRAMDYVIADWQMIGLEEEGLYVEHVARLPDVWLCWTPPAVALEPGPLPARRHGSVTFGSANRAFKMHPAQIQLWAEVVARCPASRFHLKGPPCSDKAFMDRFYAIFAERGVGPERVLCSPFSLGPAHLAFYQEIDVSLDTYPHNGGLTTLESLWMGVPVVSRSGQVFTSRFSRSYLCHLGHASWVAASEAEYVQRACELAADLDALELTRRTLREKLVRSVICDGAAFTRQLEQLYGKMLEAVGQRSVAV